MLPFANRFSIVLFTCFWVWSFKEHLFLKIAESRGYQSLNASFFLLQRPFTAFIVLKTFNTLWSSNFSLFQHKANRFLEFPSNTCLVHVFITCICICFWWHAKCFPSKTSMEVIIREDSVLKLISTSRDFKSLLFVMCQISTAEWTLGMQYYFLKKSMTCSSSKFRAFQWWSRIGG